MPHEQLRSLPGEHRFAVDLSPVREPGPITSVCLVHVSGVGALVVASNLLKVEMVNEPPRRSHSQVSASLCQRFPNRGKRGSGTEEERSVSYMIGNARVCLATAESWRFAVEEVPIDRLSFDGIHKRGRPEADAAREEVHQVGEPLSRIPLLDLGKLADRCIGEGEDCPPFRQCAEASIARCGGVRRLGIAQLDPDVLIEVHDLPSSDPGVVDLADVEDWDVDRYREDEHLGIR